MNTPTPIDPTLVQEKTSVQRAILWVQRKRKLAYYSVILVVFASCITIAGYSIWSVLKTSDQLTIEKRNADKSSRRADDFERLVQESRDNVAQVEYARTVYTAHLEYQKSNIERANLLLDSCRVEFRGWEWYYVHKLCHSDSLSFQGHTNDVLSASLSPDETRIVTACRDKTAKLWDAKTGTEILTLKGHAKMVFSASFSPDGNRIMTASQDASVKIWDANTGMETLRAFGKYEVIVRGTSCR